MFPFASQIVHRIAHKGLYDRAIELIGIIQNAPNDQALIRLLKQQKQGTFFRFTIINDHQQVLFDSHVKGALGLHFGKDYIIEHPEVLEALYEGNGQHVGYSYALGQRLTYAAKRFDFHGKPYVVRVAFPYKYILDISRNFEIGFLLLATAVLLLFSFMTWVIINHLSSPIHQIIRIIRPYQEGLQLTIPEIRLPMSKTDEFGQLSQTLNSLSAKVQHQIDTLTFERNEKAAVLETLIEGVVAVDPRLHITYINQKALQLLGCTKQQVLSNPFISIADEKCCILLKQCQERNKILHDTLELKSGGIKTYLDLIAIPKQGNQGAVFVMQDQTVHHKMLQMRRDFIANASHELKTPLTVIMGYAETLSDNLDLSRLQMQEAMQKIFVNCQRMEILIKDLLVLSDIEQLPASRLIQCDLVKIINNCCQLIRDAYSTSIVTFSSDSQACFIIADPSLIEMAVKNLIENGAKYSVPPAQIEVVLQHQNDWIKVTVTDKGIGIPAEELDLIFQRFYRVDKARTRGSSGLGLSIVESVMEKHFGRVSVLSQIGKGSAFTLWFPLIRSEKVVPQEFL